MIRFKLPRFDLEITNLEISQAHVRFLTIPASSASVERLFSTCGAIIRASRASLSTVRKQSRHCYCECNPTLTIAETFDMLFSMH